MTEELRQFQSVSYRTERGYIASFTDNGGAMFQGDNSCKAKEVRLCELQPISIKKSFGVEGNNFID